MIAQPGDRIPNPIAAAQQLHAGAVTYRRTEVRRNEDAGLNVNLKFIILRPSPKIGRGDNGLPFVPPAVP